MHVGVELTNGFTAWGVKIKTPKTARNTDGIDPISSSNVTITHCFIDTGDDNVAIKPGPQGRSTTSPSRTIISTPATACRSAARPPAAPAPSRSSTSRSTAPITACASSRIAAAAAWCTTSPTRTSACGMLAIPSSRHALHQLRGRQDPGLPRHRAARRAQRHSGRAGLPGVRRQASHRCHAGQRHRRRARARPARRARRAHHRATHRQSGAGGPRCIGQRHRRQGGRARRLRGALHPLPRRGDRAGGRGSGAGRRSGPLRGGVGKRRLLLGPARHRRGARRRAR